MTTFLDSMTMFLGKNNRTLQKCSKPSAEPSLLVLCRGAAHFRYNFATAKLQSSPQTPDYQKQHPILRLKPNKTTIHITTSQSTPYPTLQTLQTLQVLIS